MPFACVFGLGIPDTVKLIKTKGTCLSASDPPHVKGKRVMDNRYVELFNINFQSALMES